MSQILDLLDVPNELPYQFDVPTLGNTMNTMDYSQSDGFGSGINAWFPPAANPVVPFIGHPNAETLSYDLIAPSDVVMSDQIELDGKAF